MPKIDLTYQQLYDLLMDQIGSTMGRYTLDALLKAERLQCARVICSRCFAGDMPESIEYEEGKIVFVHEGNFVCDASNIWALGRNHGPV